MGFGRGMLEHWTIDSNTTYLNHGTVGVVPRRVLAAQQAIRDEMERQPARFVQRSYGRRSNFVESVLHNPRSLN